MEIAKMMMGGKSEGKYAYYAEKMALIETGTSTKTFDTIGKAGDESTGIYYSNSVNYHANDGFFYLSNPIFVSFAYFYNWDDSKRNEVFSLLTGKYFSTYGKPAPPYPERLEGRFISIDLYIEPNFGSFMRATIENYRASIENVKYGVTDEPNKYTTKTIGTDGFIYAKITGQTTV